MNPRAFIIAEAGVNHNGSLDLALKLVDVAADAGADAIKFQTFKAAKLVTAAARKADYQSERTDSTENQFDMLQRLELDRGQHERLMTHALTRSVEFMSSPFDRDSLDLLVGLGVSRLKISSGELTNSPLLLQAARSGLPVLLSTGMATLDEIRSALDVLAFGYSHPHRDPLPGELANFSSGPAAAERLQEKVTLLHCTTEYPAPMDEVNLLAIRGIGSRFGLACGFSDHTPGIAAAIAATALGAQVIEKHLTLDRSLPGPDHQASLEPGEFAQLVTSIRQVEQALGSPDKQPTPSELRNLPIVRKSLVAATRIRCGELFNAENLTTKRPGGGLAPHQYWDLLGTSATRDYEPDAMIELP